jgi:hypothetical protein
MAPCNQSTTAVLRSCAFTLKKKRHPRPAVTALMHAETTEEQGWAV